MADYGLPYDSHRQPCSLKLCKRRHLSDHWMWGQPTDVDVGENEPVAAGGQRPLSGAIKTLASLAGRTWQACSSSTPTHILAVVANTDAGRYLWMVNITDRDQKADIASLRLSDGTMGAVLTLSPYEVASVSLAEC